MKTFTRYLNTLLVTMLFGVVYVSASTHPADELWDRSAPYTGSGEVASSNVPEWEASDAATGCEPEQFDGFTNVLVVTQANEREIISFDDSWDMGHDDNTANDHWVIGYCN